MSEEETNKTVTYGVGMDGGTMNLLSARKTESGVAIKRIRDAFLDLPLDAKKMLSLSDVDYVEREDDVLILGDAALDLANTFGKEVRRPLVSGLVSPSDTDSLEVLRLLIKHILGEPAVENEYCYFSVPAAPIDKPDRDVIYHQGVLERIVTDCGYTAVASNEAMGVIYAEAAKDGFSGIGFSFGSGLTNVALSVNTIEGLSFSVSRGGDWIDSGAAKSVGITQARACAIKEKGIKLNQPETREQEAISFYYKSLISYALDQVAIKFMSIQNQFTLPKPIPIIVSGGSSLAGGFLELFKQVFEQKRKKFPIEISEIRRASNPMNAVAQGLLIQAMQEHN